MAAWTDKDTFNILRDTRDSYFHVLRLGVLNDLNGAIRTLVAKNDKRFKNISF